MTLVLERTEVEEAELRLVAAVLLPPVERLVVAEAEPPAERPVRLF